MKKYLLPESGRFYKANLHCHSTVSDGKFTPEEMKEMYQSAGYSIVAYTDHDVFLTHNHLTDENFLALNGFSEFFVFSDKLEKLSQKLVTFILEEFVTATCGNKLLF